MNPPGGPRQVVQGVDPILLAWIYAGLNDADRAFEWFDRAYHDGSCELALTNVLPALDPIRADARMDKLIERLGLPRGPRAS
jgi:hypothetical protein